MPYCVTTFEDLKFIFYTGENHIKYNLPQGIKLGLNLNEVESDKF